MVFCVKKTVEIEKKDDLVNIRPLGDVHIGNLGCDLVKFQKSIDFIKSHKNTYTIGMGDYIDNVMAWAQGGVDKRWNPETVDRDTLTTEEQIDKFVEMWRPIADKTWGLLAGNHEWKTINQRRFIKDFCEPLGLPYLGRLAYLNLTVKHNKKPLRDFLILVLHGGYSGMQAGGSMNRMKQICADWDCDLVLMGHNHDTVTRSIVRMGYDKFHNSPVEKKVILGNTGTFLRGYEKGVDSYVEINPKEAKRVGTITISLDALNGDLSSHA